jgi:glutamyl-tRNA synthetase
MGVTHILRGLEHLLNTFNHIALQDALGYPRPTYAHLSVMLNPENSQKLSKRDRDGRIRKRVQEWMRNNKKTVDDLSAASGLAVTRLSDWIKTDTMQLDLTEQPPVMKVVGLKETDLPEIMIHDFRKNGYFPEVLNNFLALQGWSPGGDLEQMSMEKMTELFSLDRINPSNPKFSRDKLLSFNTEFAAKASPERLVAGFRDYLSANPASPLGRCSDEQLARVLEMKKGFRTLQQVDEASRFLFQTDAEIVYEPDAVEKVLKKNDGQGLTVLKDLRPLLAAIADWKAAGIEQVVNGYVESSKLGLGKVAQPIRVAVSGGTVSPPIFESLELLGQEKTLSRVDRVLSL